MADGSSSGGGGRDDEEAQERLRSALSWLREGRRGQNEEENDQRVVEAPANDGPPQEEQFNVVPVYRFQLSQSLELSDTAFDLSADRPHPLSPSPTSVPDLVGTSQRNLVINESHDQPLYGQSRDLNEQTENEPDGINHRPSLSDQSHDINRQSHDQPADPSFIEQLMERSVEERLRRESEEAEARIQQEREAAEAAENARQLSHIIRHCSKVPCISGDSTASDTVSEGEGMSLRRRRESRDSDQSAPVQHPLSITHVAPSVCVEAALAASSTTESEPDQLIPGTKYENLRIQKVPILKKRALEKLRRESINTSSSDEELIDRAAAARMRRSVSREPFGDQPTTSSSHDNHDQTEEQTSESPALLQTDTRYVTETQANGSVTGVTTITQSDTSSGSRSEISDTQTLSQSLTNPQWSSTPDPTGTEEAASTPSSSLPSSTCQSDCIKIGSSVLFSTVNGELPPAGTSAASNVVTTPSSTPLAVATPSSSNAAAAETESATHGNKSATHGNESAPLRDESERKIVPESVDDMDETQPLADTSSSQQELFLDSSHNSQFEMANQVPAWMLNQQNESTDEEKTELLYSSKRSRLEDSSSSSSGSSNPLSSPIKCPPSKRRHEDNIEVHIPQWMKGPSPSTQIPAPSIQVSAHSTQVSTHSIQISTHSTQVSTHSTQVSAHSIKSPSLMHQSALPVPSSLQSSSSSSGYLASSSSLSSGSCLSPSVSLTSDPISSRTKQDQPPPPPPPERETVFVSESLSNRDTSSQSTDNSSSNSYTHNSNNNNGSEKSSTSSSDSTGGGGGAKRKGNGAGRKGGGADENGGGAGGSGGVASRQYQCGNDADISNDGSTSSAATYRGRSATLAALGNDGPRVSLTDTTKCDNTSSCEEIIPPDPTAATIAAKEGIPVVDLTLSLTESTQVTSSIPLLRPTEPVSPLGGADVAVVTKPLLQQQSLETESPSILAVPISSPPVSVHSIADMSQLSVATGTASTQLSFRLQLSPSQHTQYEEQLSTCEEDTGPIPVPDESEIMEIGNVASASKAPLLSTSKQLLDDPIVILDSCPSPIPIPTSSGLIPTSSGPIPIPTSSGPIPVSNSDSTDNPVHSSAGNGHIPETAGSVSDPQTSLIPESAELVPNPVPVYESLQLSNSEQSPSLTEPSLKATPTTINTPDTSQVTSSGTFSFRLPQENLLRPLMQVTPPQLSSSNDDQSNGQNKTNQSDNSSLLVPSRSPGRSLSLRTKRASERRSHTGAKRMKLLESVNGSESEQTGNESKQTEYESKRTENESEQTENQSVQTVRRLVSNRIEESENQSEVIMHHSGFQEPDTENTETEENRNQSIEREHRDETNTDNSSSGSDSEAIRPIAEQPEVPRISTFVLGTDEKEEDELGGGAAEFDDSCLFEIPSIAEGGESDLSPFDFSLARPDNVATISIPPVSTTVPVQKSSSSLFAGLRANPRTQQEARIDQFDFQAEGSSTPPIRMPLRRRRRTPSDNESPLPLDQHPNPSEQQEETSTAVTASSTPVKRKVTNPNKTQAISGCHGNVSISNTESQSSAGGYATPTSNVLPSPVPSQSFVSPSSCLTPRALKDMLQAHPHSPFVRLRHVTMVTTTSYYIRNELIDQLTGNVLETQDEVEGPSEQQRRTSIEIDPLLNISSTASFHSVSSAVSPKTTQSSAHITCQSSLSSTSSAAAVNRSVIDCTTVATPTRREAITTPISSGDTSETDLCSRSSVVREKKQLSSTCDIAGSSSFTFTVNQKVVAKWKDSRWYAGTLLEVSPRKVYVEYYDGNSCSVSVQHIIPLAALPEGVQVSTVDTNHTGSFIDCSIKDSTFRLKLNNDTIISSPLEDLVLTGDTAEMTRQLVISTPHSETQATRRKKSTHHSISTDEGSLSLNESRLFCGLIFLVTDHRQDHHSSGSSSEVYMRRERVEAMIRERGGYIIEEYKPNLVIDKRTFCLSNTHCRTVKYLIALAVNIPCVSYEWIRECIEQGKIVDHTSFYLSVGVSPLTKELIKWSERPKNFLKVKIFIFGGRPFKEFWERVTLSGGGTVVRKLPSSTSFNRKGSHHSEGLVIITDKSTTPPPSVISLPVIIVSSDWLVQCLLEGQIVSAAPFKR